jgi:hypothetical protein
MTVTMKDGMLAPGFWSTELAFRLFADLVEEVSVRVRIAQTLLHWIVQMILAHVHPYSTTAKLLTLTIRECERHPVLILCRFCK